MIVSGSDRVDCEGLVPSPAESQKVTLVDCSWLVDPHLMLVVWHPVAG